MFDTRPWVLPVAKTKVKFPDHVAAWTKTVKTAIKKGTPLLLDATEECPDFIGKLCTQAKYNKTFPEQVSRGVSRNSFLVSIESPVRPAVLPFPVSCSPHFFACTSAPSPAPAGRLLTLLSERLSTHEAQRFPMRVLSTLLLASPYPPLQSSCIPILPLPVFYAAWPRHPC